MTRLAEEGREASFLEHIDELRIRFTRVAITVGVLAVVIFAFRIQPVGVAGYLVPILYPDPFENIATQFITRIKADVLPSFVKVIVTNPTQAFTAQVYLSLFLAVVLGMPVIVREVAGFVGPALYPHEKRMILRLLVPATGLFVAGAWFAYVLVTPFGLDFLYRFGLVAVDQPFITLEDLVTFVAWFSLGMGGAFQLPIVMWAVTKAGLVEPRFWRDNFRYAAVGMVILGALVTPDGSGITMWFVAAPLILLYMAGYLVVRNTGKMPASAPAGLAR